MSIIRLPLLLLALFAVLQSPALASKHEYKKAKVYGDEKAWYVGSWQGLNTAFDPALPVEITILGSGDVYCYSQGQNRAYRVTQGDKVIKLDKLADTPMRGKMLDPATIILEDGGKLQIAKTADGGLQTTVPDLGIVVHSKSPEGPVSLAAIQQRVAAQQEKEAHYKDHDFWHSEAFWGAVAAGAVSGASNHDDRVEVEAPSLSKEEIDQLNSLSTYNK